MHDNKGPELPELPETEQALPALLWLGDQIPGGFFIYRADDEQEILYVNRATLRIFGCDTLEEFKDLTGYTFNGMMHPDDAAKTQDSIDAQIADQSNEDMDYVEYRIVRKDGEIRWVDDYGHFARLPGYGDVYYVFIMDVTDKRLAEEERFQMELALENERQSNEMKNAFLFNLSHDIRTPMNAVIGFSELAKQHKDDAEKLDEYLGKVENSGQLLLSLIDDMLEMNNLNAGNAVLKAEPTDMREQLDLVVDLYRTAADEKQLSIVVDAELPDELVMVDQSSFRRVMDNLLGNAVKFTPAGGSVTVSARRVDTGADDSRSFADTFYEFSVADTGVGMSEDFMARMYDAFEREESSTKTGDTGTGTGLGLSIAKGLLDQMGGTISAVSEKGKGSTFTVGLPLKLAEEADANGEQAADDADEEHTDDGEAADAAETGAANAADADAEDSFPHAAGEYRILIVDDVELNRMLAETLLEESGFLVESVPDGCDAVDAVRNHPENYYDLILMDIQMPIMDGYEATRAIRALDRKDAAELPILALSANTRDEDKRQSIESGMDEHVAKPFDIGDLVFRINDHIARRG